MQQKITSELNKLILNKNIQKYIELAYSVKQNGYPFMSYFGFNYRDNELLNFKVYFRFHNPLSSEEVLKLLPDNSHFLLHYDKAGIGKINDVYHTGVTFALKINTQGIITHYFHYLIYDYKNEIPIHYPQKYLLKPGDDKMFQKINSVEYAQTKQLNKRYYTITDKIGVSELLKRFDIKHHFTSLKHLEYTETEKFDKIILGIFSQEEQCSYMDSLPESCIKNMIKLLCEKYNLMTCSPAIYDDLRTRAIYFTLQDDTHFFSNKDTISHLKETLFTMGV